nr:transposon TX1 [Tanacetum cinerariifolium]
MDRSIGADNPHPDVEALLKMLREIKFGEESLNIFIAFDRKIPSNRTNITLRRSLTKKGKIESTICAGRIGMRDMENKGEQLEKEENENVRTIEVDDEEINTSFFNKCVIRDVKSLCYLTKLASFYRERGLNNVEVKLLGGLEVMIVFDTPETVLNILRCIDHGLRRWDEEDDGNEVRLEDDDGQKREEDDESMYSGRSRVYETHAVVIMMEEKLTVPREDEVGDNINDIGEIKNKWKCRRGNIENKNKSVNTMDENSVKGGKRDDRPTTSNFSRGNKHYKKRKQNGDDDGEEVSNLNINKNGSKDVKFENGVRGLGTVEKGVSDVYKDFHDVGNDKNETFVFRSTGRVNLDSKSCSINKEQVKEIGELIRVSWAKVESENARDVENVKKANEKAEKKGWIKSIIRNDRPSITGVQETKCGVVDDLIIEELWGRGFGFT